MAPKHSEDIKREAVRIATLNLDAEPCPAGTMDVVLGPGWPGILLHEAIGFAARTHPAFADVLVDAGRFA